MAGLDKILSQINEESSLAVKKINDEVNEKCNNILTEAKKGAEKKAREIIEKSERDAMDIEHRAQSTADLKKRQAILACKQEIISDVIEKAKESLYSLPDVQYFDFIMKLVEKYIKDKDVQLGFSQKDLERMPSNFKSELDGLARDNNGSIEVLKEAVDIDGGFILFYDKIEENCSISAMFDANYELLQDKVQRILFS